jgi:hypothetical protein
MPAVREPRAYITFHMFREGGGSRKQSEISPIADGCVPNCIPKYFFLMFVLFYICCQVTEAQTCTTLLGKDSTTDRTVDSGWGEGVSQTKPTMMGATEGGTDQ